MMEKPFDSAQGRPYLQDLIKRSKARTAWSNAKAKSQVGERRSPRRNLLRCAGILVVLLSAGAFFSAVRATRDASVPSSLQEVAPSTVGSTAAPPDSDTNEFQTDTVKVIFRDAPPRDEMLVPDSPPGQGSTGY